MATSQSLGGLNSWAVAVGALASGTGAAVVHSAPGKIAVALSGSGTSVIVGVESTTTPGQYTFTGRHATTVASGAVFIL